MLLKKVAVFSVAALALAFVCQSANAQVIWSDNFDSYTAGPIVGSAGAFNDFGGAMPAVIDDTLSNSPGNALRMDEGAGTDTGAGESYGSDIFVNFPSIYTSGTYRFEWSSYINDGMDTLHRMFVSQGQPDNVSSVFATGLDIYHDGNDFVGAGVPTVLGVDGAGIAPGNGPIAGLALEIMVRNAWVPQALTVDLDNNVYQWEYNGVAVTVPGDGPQDPDGNYACWNTEDGFTTGPSLGGINFWTGSSVAGDNDDGIAGSVWYDDFSLSVAPSLGAFPQCTIPEPSSALMVLVAAMGMLGFRRK